MEMLHNYHNLVAKVDELCFLIREKFGPHLACGPGCSGCCRHLSLSWVEGVAMAAALGELPADEADFIRARARVASASSPCPLLSDDRCLMYAFRPIICRTHGLPLLTVNDKDERRVDFCPQNFVGLSSLPGSAIIDLERLNAALNAINVLFIGEYFSRRPPPRERLLIAEALLLTP